MDGAPKTLDDVQKGGHELIALCRDTRCRFRKTIDLRRLIMNVGGWHQLLPKRGEPHFSDRMRCPSCKRMGMSLWLEPRLPPPRASSEPNFRVLDWGRTYPYSTFTMIATADNLMVARGAYVAAVLFYPDKWITLQQGAFVVEDSKRDGIPKHLTAEDYKIMRDGEMSLSGVPVRSHLDEGQA